MFYPLTLNPSPKLIVIVVALVAILAVAVYAVTVLFTQTAPGPSIPKPGAGSIVSDCNTLSSSLASIPATSQYQTGAWADTCGGSATVTVTTSGTLLIGVSYPPNSEAGYTGFFLTNYTQTTGCNQQMTSVPLTGNPTSLALSAGPYYYCIHYWLSAYNSNTPQAFPALTITWESP